MELAKLIKTFGGVVSTAQLIRCGNTEREIREAVATGFLTRIRRGWYATRDADSAVVEAVRAGGVASCLTALGRHGVWVPEHPRDCHFRVTRHGQIKADDACRRYGRDVAAVGAVDDVATALLYSPHCVDELGFRVLCESILNKKLMRRAAMVKLFKGGPAYLTDIVRHADDKPESGTETIAAQRFIGAGFSVRPQVWIAPDIRVDLLVGEVLALEIDSRAHHTGEDNYESDRARDLKVTALGYIPQHLTYKQVVHQWPKTLEQLQILARLGMHRGPRRRNGRRKIAG